LAAKRAQEAIDNEDRRQRQLQDKLDANARRSLLQAKANQNVADKKMPTRSSSAIRGSKTSAQFSDPDEFHTLTLGEVGEKTKHITANSKVGASLDSLFSTSAFSPQEKKGKDEEVLIVTKDPQGGFDSAHLSVLHDLLPPQDEKKVKGDGRKNLMEDKDRKLFMNQFNAYKAKNAKIHTIKQYVIYILKHQKNFISKTIARAKSYTPILH